MLASSISGFWCGVARGFVQGLHVAYSSASYVKSFAFCYCSQVHVVHAVILFPALPSLLLW